MKKLTSLLTILLICVSAFAQETVSVSGKVLSSENLRPVVSASVNLDGTNISIITNSEGDFTLKMPASLAQGRSIVISHLGYVLSETPVSSFPEGQLLTIYMIPMTLQLDAAIVKSIDAKILFRTAFSRVKENYPDEHIGMTTFYREMIRKDNTKYLVLNEAVIDVDKAPYNSYNTDRASIYKGRGSINYNVADTLFIKFQGGIMSALAIDIAKNPFMDENLFTATDVYDFSMGEIANIDDKPFYTLNFKPRKSVEDIRFKGTLYIDTETFAIARTEFGLDVNDLNRVEAAKIFVVKTPGNMHYSIDQAEYIVNYKEVDGKWYFDYSMTNMVFEVRKARSLFRHHYTIVSEMAVTDHKPEATIIENTDRVARNEILSDDISAFEDPDFWEDYNIIQPDQSIQNVIQRIIRQLNRRNK